MYNYAWVSNVPVTMVQMHLEPLHPCHTLARGAQFLRFATATGPCGRTFKKSLKSCLVALLQLHLLWQPPTSTPLLCTVKVTHNTEMRDPKIVCETPWPTTWRGRTMFVVDIWCVVYCPMILWYYSFRLFLVYWGRCALHHCIRSSMEAILACPPLYQQNDWLGGKFPYTMT